jgi:hypothetical protein
MSHTYKHNDQSSQRAVQKPIEKQQPKENAASIPTIQVTPATPKNEKAATTRQEEELESNEKAFLTVPSTSKGDYKYPVNRRLGRPKKPIPASLKTTSTGTVVTISRETHDVQFTIPNINGWYTPKVIEVVDEVGEDMFVVSVEGEEREVKASPVEQHGAVSSSWNIEG